MFACRAHVNAVSAHVIAKLQPDQRRELLRVRDRSDTRLGRFVGSEQKRQSLENFTQSGRREDADALAQSTAIDGAKLGDVHDAGPRKPGLAALETNIPGHRPKPEIRRYGCNNGGGDRAPVEPIVLHHQGRSPPRRCRALGSAEV